MPRRLTQQQMTLSDLEWPFHPYRALSFRQCRAYRYYRLLMRRGNAFGRVCLSVCVCRHVTPVRADFSPENATSQCMFVLGEKSLSQYVGVHRCKQKVCVKYCPILFCLATCVHQVTTRHFVNIAGVRKFHIFCHYLLTYLLVCLVLCRVQKKCAADDNNTTGVA